MIEPPSPPPPAPPFDAELLRLAGKLREAQKMAGDGNKLLEGLFESSPWNG